MSNAESRHASWGRPSYVWRFGQERRLGLIRNFLSLEEKRVLDVGCGIGTYVRRLARFGGQIHGVDIDPAKVCKAKDASNSVSVASGEALPYPQDYFDIVLLHEVIEHVEDDRRAVGEALRCTRPGGHVVILAPNRLYPLETHGINWRGRHREGNIPLINYFPSSIRNKLCPYARAYTTKELQDIASDSRADTLVHTQIYAGYDNIVEQHPRVGNILRRVSYALEESPLKVFGLSHFMILRKVHPPSSESGDPDGSQGGNN
jgi:SAM-dependent methyltransferase